MNHFAKFIFLAVMIGAVLFSRMAYPAASENNAAATEGNSGGANTALQAVPLFVMPAAVSPMSVSPTANPIVPPQTSGAMSLVMNLTNGAVLASSNAEKRWPTASLTKLMTATVALDKIDAKTNITITEAMFAADPTEPTLTVGGIYSANDLLRAMLLPSSNVATEAIAAFYGRSRFIDEMNARALAWGMTNTYFGDPSGISAANQSTADDLAKLAKKILADYPEIFATTRTAETSVTELHSGKQTAVKSINTFAGRPDFVGGKTGYTSEAAGNLLSIFRSGGQTVLIIVLGTENRFGDTQKLYDWFKTNF